MMIKDFLDERPMVSLFTRPRRFGKTLNMDMLRTFFEKTDEDTSEYFKDKQIWACGKKYREYQGKYPVIFITFKDVKRSTWDETFDMIKELITSEYKRHAELAASDLVTDKKTYDRIINREATRTDYERSFLVLSQTLLHLEFNRLYARFDVKFLFDLLHDACSFLFCYYSFLLFQYILESVTAFLPCRILISAFQKSPFLFGLALTAAPHRGTGIS